jgi:hypothetical protein
MLPMTQRIPESNETHHTILWNNERRKRSDRYVRLPTIRDLAVTLSSAVHDAA